MPAANRLYSLRIGLIAVGLAFIFGLYPICLLLPSFWTWGESPYAAHFAGIYAMLGVFLLIASRNPAEHKSLIWFTVWSSAAHGAIMAAQAIGDEAMRGHFLGDIPAMFIVAIVLGVLMRRAGI